MTDQFLVLDIVKAVGAVAIPTVIFLLGYKFNHLSLIASLTESLASESRKRRLIALMVVGHLRGKNTLPKELLDSLSVIAAGDDQEIASAALVATGDDHIPDTVLLLELYAPLKVHFDRTEDAFESWKGFNEKLENEIMKSNKSIRDRLISKWHLIPCDLKKDAQNLITHYDAWLKKYDKLRPDGVRDTSQPFVFVGPDGYPFPYGSAQKFLEKYNSLAGVTDN